MNRTINALAIAVAGCLASASTVQAQGFVDRPPMAEPAPSQEVIVGPRSGVSVPATRGRIVSGATLSGRRETISDDAIIIGSGDQRRAIVRDGDDVRSLPVLRGGRVPEGNESEMLEDFADELEED